MSDETLFGETMWVSEDDPRSICEHGSTGVITCGWCHPMTGFRKGESIEDRETRILSFPSGPLVNEWCKHTDPHCEFRCYPEDGACSCGHYRHHVHGTCGGIIQTG